MVKERRQILVKERRQILVEERREKLYQDLVLFRLNVCKNMKKEHSSRQLLNEQYYTYCLLFLDSEVQCQFNLLGRFEL